MGQGYFGIRPLGDVQKQDHWLCCASHQEEAKTMRGSYEFKVCLTCVALLALIYQFAPAELFTPFGMVLFASAVLHGLWVMLRDVL